MYKKIIGIFIMTLLIVTAIPVTGQIKEISISKDYQEIIKKAEPDFIVRKIELDYTYGGDIGDRVSILTGIDNIGSPVEKMSVRLRLSFEDYPEFTTNHIMEYEGNGLKYHGNPWPGLLRPLRNKNIYTLIVEVDPDNEIPELNDENNVKTKTVIFLPRFNEIFSKKVTNDVVSPLSNGDKWMKTFGGPGHDYGKSVQQTSDGGYITLGITAPSGSVEYDILLIKTDADGNKIWDKKFGGAKSDKGESVKQTSDGGYIITGKTESYGSGNGDIWLIKTDSDGNIVWDKTFDCFEHDHGFDVIEISSGGFIIVGQTNPSGPEYNPDVWVIKTDSDGNKIWDKRYGEERPNGGRSVQEVNDGGYIITGNYHAVGNTMVRLLKINSNGELLWDKKYDKNDIDHGESVQQTSDGGFIITGETLSDGLERYDIWLIKTDSEGNLLWDKTFDVKGHDFGNSVQQTTDGGYIIAGFTENLLLKNEGLLIKTDSNGEKEWIKTYDYKSRGGIICAVQQTSDEGYILTGGVSYSLLFTDVWVIKTDSNGNVPMSRARNLMESRLFELFPNLFPILQRLLLRLGQ